MRWGAALVLITLGAGLALAEGPKTSIRPLARPDPAAQAPAPAVILPSVQTTTTLSVPHPKARPAGLQVAAASVTPATNGAVQALPTNAASAAKVPFVRPKARPANLVSLAAAAPAPGAPAAKPSGKATRKGSVCGDRDIRGAELVPITSKTTGCGLAEPVKVTMISGVALNPAATISCDTAAALKQWIETGMEPAFGNRQVIELRIAGSYTCRSRNNVRGARISEHGKGNAIDIAGFVMSNGTTWTVENDYNKTIRKAYKAGCGIFGTTLGPGSDGYHEDHLHFDIAHHSNGPYCR